MSRLESKETQDVELGALRDGYPALAAWMAQDPDNETFILRKFDRLAARNLLHLQAKITALEYELDTLDETTRRSNDLEARQSLRRWETLMKHAEDVNRTESKIVRKLDELNQQLREYYETLLRQSQIAEMRKPEDRPLFAFRDFLNGAAFQEKGTGPMPLISGQAKTFLDNEGDLLAFTKPVEEDYLSRFLQNHWLFKKRKTSDPFDRTTIYRNSHIVRTVAALDLVLAAILLIGAIVNLYFVAGQKAKLGLVAMYTMLFASSVALCTNARRAEVFAATAAYAAVLVVFVSGDLGGSKSEQCMIQLEGAIWKTVRCPD